MIRHVALLRFTEDVTPGAIDALTDALEGLPDVIDEIVAFSCGPDVGRGPTNLDYGVVADFADLFQTLMSALGQHQFVGVNLG